MTHAEYFSFIRSGLRQKSRRWAPVYLAKQLARRPNESDNKRLKWEFQCNACKNWFPDKETVVDHIIDCGSLKGYDDLVDFVKRLFCEVDGFQILCKPCHKIKTNEATQSKKEARQQTKSASKASVGNTKSKKPARSTKRS
jgi:5-methylcytosine-specific restriction endonuclease McrA